MLENGCWTLDLGWRLSFASCRMLETPRNRLPTAKPTNIQHLTSQHPLLSDRDDLDIALPALDSEEQLGKTVQTDKQRRIEQTGGDFGGFFLAAIARQSQRDHGVVVRPDRAVVIGHGVKARRGSGGRADAPACEQLHAEKG